MAKLSYKNFEKQTISGLLGKSGTIRIGTKAQLRSTLRAVGIDVPKGATTFVWEGNTKEFRKAFYRVSFDIPTGSKKKPFRDATLLIGTSLKKLTFVVGKTDLVSSKGKNIRYKNWHGEKIIDEHIPRDDAKQFINFGLRQDGTPRTGYTPTQCAYSYLFRKYGSRAKHRGDRGKGSLIDQAMKVSESQRIQIMKDKARSGGLRTQGVKNQGARK